MPKLRAGFCWAHDPLRWGFVGGSRTEVRTCCLSSAWNLKRRNDYGSELIFFLSHISTDQKFLIF